MSLTSTVRKLYLLIIILPNPTEYTEKERGSPGMKVYGLHSLEDISTKKVLKRLLRVPGWLIS